MYLFSVFISIIYLSSQYVGGTRVLPSAGVGHVCDQAALGEDTHGQDSDRGGHVTDTVCFVLSTKYFRSSTEYKSFGFPSYSPTVHLICRHSRATIGLYDGETVCI